MATVVRPSSGTLSPLEALMWRLERDPRLRSTFGSVSLLDRAPDLDRLRARLRGALIAVPRLRLRIVDDRGPLGLPHWEPDPDFDLDRHLVAVERTGADVRTVLDHATALVASPLDQDHPLWTFEVVTGLDGGRAALVQRMHHTITDGEGGIRFSAQFLDADRDAARPMAAPRPPAAADGDHPAGPVELLGDVARGAVDLGRWAAGGLLHPSRFTDAGADAIDLARSLGRQLAVVDHGRSEPWRSRSDGRHLEVVSVSFADVRAVADTADVSVNDVFVAAAARAAGAYHREVGADLPELRVAMPVSTRRRGGGGGGNAFSPTRVLLPTDGDDPRAHLAEVSSRLHRTKREAMMQVIEPLAGLADVVPAAVLSRLARRQAETIDLTVSNVRAAPFPVHVAGARILATWALGPVAATPCNITMMSYAGRVDLGLHSDPAAVRAPRRLRAALVSAFADLGVADLGVP